MNTKLVLGIVIAVAVVGGGWYLWSGRGAETDMDTQQTQTTGGTQTGGTQTTPASSETTSDIRGVLARGGNYLCTFESHDPNSNSSGTVYVQGNDVRGDFQSNVKTVGLVESHMISVGGYVYTWTNAAPTAGFKTKATAQTDLPNAISTSLGGSVQGEGTSASWSCRAWTPDTTKFDLPKGITFTLLPQTR